MMRCLVGVQLTVSAWREAVAVRLRDDSGAITTEAVIITALLGAAALGLAYYIANTVVPGWQSDIPQSGDTP